MTSTERTKTDATSAGGRGAAFALPPLGIVLVLLAGCGDNGFVPPSLIMGPRLLAVVAEPPEVLPGQDITLTPVVAMADGAQFTMEVDLSTAALAAAAGQALGQDAPPISLTVEDGVATLRGADTEAAVAAMLDRVGDAQTGTPGAVVRQVYEQVGLEVVVEVRMLDAAGGVLVHGFKRIVLTPRDAPTSNPPPPRFAIDGRWVRGAPGSSDCVPESEAPIVTAGRDVVLSPADDADWLERYPALDLEGVLVEGQENGYYSWFATGGEFVFDVTRSPERTVVWTPPHSPGRIPLWLVVRDGHLGTSACRAWVNVETE